MMYSLIELDVKKCNQPAGSFRNRRADYLSVYLWSVLCCMALFCPLCIVFTVPLLYHFGGEIQKPIWSSMSSDFRNRLRP